MNQGAKPAVVLLSGGLDSATALAVARRDGFRCPAPSIAYGQRHAPQHPAARPGARPRGGRPAANRAAPRRVAQSLGAAEHRVIGIDLRAVGGSALTAEV